MMSMAMDMRAAAKLPGPPKQERPSLRERFANACDRTYKGLRVIGFTTQLALTGGAMAYMIAPDETLEALENFKSNFFTSPSLLDLPVSAEVDAALRTASAKLGLPYSFMRVTVAKESTNDPGAYNKSTKACGLTQLLQSTQLELMYRYGAKHGYADMSQHVERYWVKNKSGERIAKYRVNNGKYNDVIALCKDPLFSALMGGELAIENLEKLRSDFPGRTVNYTDLYMYHLFGRNGGERFIERLDNAPNHAAKDYYPSWLVGKNRGTFFNSNGSPRSFQSIYDIYEKKIGSWTIANAADLKTPVAVPA